MSNNECRIYLSDTSAFALSLSNAVKGEAGENVAMTLLREEESSIDGFVPYEGRKFVAQVDGGRIRSLPRGGASLLMGNQMEFALPVPLITRTWWEDDGQERHRQRSGQWPTTPAEAQRGKVGFQVERLFKYAIRTVVSPDIASTDRARNALSILRNTPEIGFWWSDDTRYIPSYHFRMGLSMREFGDKVRQKKEQGGGGCAPIDTAGKLADVRVTSGLSQTDFESNFRRVLEVCDYKMVYVTPQDLAELSQGYPAPLLDQVRESFEQTRNADTKNNFVLQFGRGVKDLLQATRLTARAIRETYENSQSRNFPGVTL